MSKVLVTGAAGFIGSHLCEALLRRNCDVVGVDAFIPYYAPEIKRRNIADAERYDNFEFHPVDLRTADLAPVLNGCEVVIHLAAMPGLMKSWSDFQSYSSCNIDATQRLLEACKTSEIEHFIHGSTSSVYGRNATGPETAPLKPVSPYGLTKLAAEHLCRAYEEHFDLPLTILRFFSVYGPRQRPDMAYTILLGNLLTDNAPFTRFGDGEQTRSNTYVADCVEAILATFDRRENVLGETLNIGGGQVVSLNDVIRMAEELTGTKARIEVGPVRPGDQTHTQADIAKAARLLGYAPSTSVMDGLRNQVEWLRGEIARAAG